MWLWRHLGQHVHLSHICFHQVFLAWVAVTTLYIESIIFRKYYVYIEIERFLFSLLYISDGGSCLFYVSYPSTIHLSLFILPPDFEGNVKHMVAPTVCYPYSQLISPIFLWT